jgi:hypothetical protein
MAESHDQLVGLIVIGAICLGVVIVVKLANKLSSFLWLGFAFAAWSFIFANIQSYIKGTFTATGFMDTIRFFYAQRGTLWKIAENFFVLNNTAAS